MNFESFSLLWKKRRLSQADKQYIELHATHLKLQAHTWDLLYLEENPDIATCPFSDIVERLRCLSVYARMESDTVLETLYAFLASEHRRDIRYYFKKLEPHLQKMDPSDHVPLFSLLGFYVYHPEQWALLVNMWMAMDARKAIHQIAEYIIHSIQCMYYLLNHHLTAHQHASLLDSSSFFEETRKYFVWTDLFQEHQNPLLPLLHHFQIFDIFDPRLDRLHHDNDRYFMCLRTFLLYWRDGGLITQSYESLCQHFHGLDHVSYHYGELLVMEMGDAYAQDLFSSLGLAPFLSAAETIDEETDLYLL